MLLEELLKDLKSVEIITDPVEIHRHLDEATKKNLVRVAGGSAHTRVGELKDGRAKVTKVTSMAAALAKAMPTMPTGDALKTLVASRGLEWFDEYSERTMSYWASDERVDGHGDIVRQNWRFDEYQKNPVLAYSHDWINPPIGAGLDWAITTRTDGGYTGPALWLLTVFATEETSQFADSIFRLVKAGLLKAGSVGFFSGKLINVQDEAERAKLGLGKWGYILDDNHLLEFSPTPIGANSGALTIAATAKRKGCLLPADVNVIRDLHRRAIAETSRDAKEWGQVDGQWRSIASTLFPGFEFQKHLEIDAPIIDVEDRRVKGSVTVKTASIEEEVAQLRAVVEETLTGLVTMVSDIRDQVEAITARLDEQQTNNSGSETSSDADPQEPEGKTGELATHARLAALGDDIAKSGQRLKEILG